MEIHARLGNTMIMITHDVDEAVLLSDRIVMMTNGPAAHIGEILDVPIPRPRPTDAREQPIGSGPGGWQRVEIDRTQVDRHEPDVVDIADLECP